MSTSFLIAVLLAISLSSGVFYNCYSSTPLLYRNLRPSSNLHPVNKAVHLRHFLPSKIHTRATCAGVGSDLLRE